VILHQPLSGVHTTMHIRCHTEDSIPW